MATRVNDVTLFSNGIGHFRRTYQVPKKSTTITIPFKTDAIGDVAASLQVFGKVKLDSPPSFTPANANATSLKIDPTEAMKSLLRQLSGAKVAINTNTIGSQGKREFTLLGLDEQEIYTAHGNLSEPYIVLQDDTGIVRYKLTDLARVEFTEDAIKAEIAKAHKSNFQKIKPDSTLLDITISSLADGETEAVVQYTIPVAAWKMRYGIRQEGTAFMLEGAAIIDNNTDEDWDNFRVSVVTGNPISFLTDIANVVVPKRRFISLVDAESLGNVSVEEGQTMMAVRAAAATKGGGRRAMARSLGPKMSSHSNYASFGLESAPEMDAELCDAMDIAEAPGVEAKEVGDFCVFTSKEPITVLARKSALVPMFSAKLEQAGVVLLYKESNHARRPFRAVKFKNETTYSLGQGKTIIYNDGTFSGECVLEATKPGENRMLPHCLENGVKIVKQTKGVQQRRSSIRISDGVAVDEYVHTAVSEYAVENKKDEPFKIALEHLDLLADSKVSFDGVSIQENEKISNGYRVYFELAPKQKVTLTVTEVAVQGQKISLSDFGWLTSVVSTYQPLAEDKQVKKCAELQSQIDEKNRESQEALQRKAGLEQQAGRVRQNLASTKDQGGELVNKWLGDLDASETEIRKITDDMMPRLSKEIHDLQKKLRAELKKILINWTEEVQKPKSVK